MTIAQKEKIEQEFTDIIREKFTDKEFWDWTRQWLDTDYICKIAEGWDIDDKLTTIKDYKN